MHRTWVEVSKNALAHNVRLFKRTLKPALLMAVVKSNAYGHGLVGASKVFSDAGADWFGVDSLDEALIIRKQNIKKPILIMGYVPKDGFLDVFKNNLNISVYNEETLKNITHSAQKYGKKAFVHLKIETGMNRQGMKPEFLPTITKYFSKNSPTQLKGIYTHFASAGDIRENKFTENQGNELKKAYEYMQKSAYADFLVHSSATAGALLYPNFRMSLARVGIGLYGMLPSNDAKKSEIGKKIKPALTWKTIIVQVKKISKNETVGYARSEKIKKDAMIAVLPVGYYDGYDRKFSSQGIVSVQNKLCRVVGRVCMNMMMVDVSNVKNCKAGDEAILIGKNNGAEQMAEKIGTIGYEIIARINPLIQRIYK